MVFFALCTWILVRRKRGRFRIQCFLITALFSLVTASLALDFAVALLENQLKRLDSLNGFSFGFPSVGPGEPQPFDVNQRKPSFLDHVLPWDEEKQFWTWHLGSVKGALQSTTITLHIITDMILLWRCYFIWGNHISWVVIVPSLACLAKNVIGILALTPCCSNGRPDFNYDLEALTQHGESRASHDHNMFLLYYTSGSCCANILLTSIIGGRIFYLSHQAARLSTQCMSELYKTIIHAFLDSGLLYPVNLVLYTSFLLKVQLKPRKEHLVDVNIAWDTCLKLSYTMLVTIMVGLPLATHFLFEFYLAIHQLSFANSSI
ncbi:hypothetical protein PM082_012471 [Marasmius tenuissimus]|nr:hypothetical protein PM082_012471 [Marasmius tenuissimus]